MANSRSARSCRSSASSGSAWPFDKLDGFGFLALQAEGIALTDSGPATVDAREVKTLEEVQLMIINGGIGDAILADFEAAIRPGIREYELSAELGHALLRRHGEFLFTRLVASGTNTNPWMSEAHDKIVMPGDLVGVTPTPTATRATSSTSRARSSAATRHRPSSGRPTAWPTTASSGCSTWSGPA